MKKTITIVGLLVLIAAAVTAYFVFTAPSAKLPAAESSASTTPSPSPEITVSPEPTANDLPEVAGKYVEYKDLTDVTSTAGTKLLFFHAPWCPQCRALEKDITSVTLPENLTIFKVDYDTNQSLRQKYGVTLQTTMVNVDDSGNLIEKYVAYDKPNFASVKQNLLD